MVIAENEENDGPLRDFAVRTSSAAESCMKSNGCMEYSRANRAEQGNGRICK